jgi:UDP-N-acetylmuramoylalanine--D-glutamate ligase
LQNALAAIAAVKALSVGDTPVRTVLRSFAGLPHRLEAVRRLDGIDYVNNSMCTNPAAGASSLEAIAWSQHTRHKVVVIAGGKEKSLPMGEYVDALASLAAGVVLVGDSREMLARELGRRGCRHYEVCNSLRQAVVAARNRARPCGVVLFSPGFASFDQYTDFQARGRAFIHEVRRLG